jgi:hypothetical protein
MHRVGQPLFGCALDQKCTALATPPSVVPSIESAPRPADSATIFAPCQPFRLCLPTISVVLPAIAAVLASYYSCAPIFGGPLRSAWPIGLARLRIHLPTISVVLANHFGCAASYCSCACQLLQLCPHLFGAVAIGLADRPGPSSDSPANHPGCACQPFRLCLPAIIAGLASYCSCAHLSRTVAGPLRMMTGTYHLITPGLSIECMRSPFGAPLRFAHSHTPALATVLP